MSLDHAAADREPDAHAVALRRVKGVEQLIHDLEIEAGASVTHGCTHMVAALLFGSDQQLARAIVDADQRVRAVAEQIQNDLLELDAIASDRREALAS